MQTCEIRILPEAEDFLSILPQTLVAEGYLSTYEAAGKSWMILWTLYRNCRMSLIIRLTIRWLIICLFGYGY